MDLFTFLIIYVLIGIVFAIPFLFEGKIGKGEKINWIAACMCIWPIYLICFVIENLKKK